MGRRTGGEENMNNETKDKKIRDLRENKINENISVEEEKKMEEQLAKLRKARRELRRARRNARQTSIENDPSLLRDVTYFRNVVPVERKETGQADYLSERDTSAWEAAGWGPEPTYYGNEMSPGYNDQWGWSSDYDGGTPIQNKTSTKKDSIKQDIDMDNEFDSIIRSLRSQKRRVESKISGLRGEKQKKGEDSGIPEETKDDLEYEYDPDIVILSPQELDRVLPVVPFSNQADFFSGGPTQAVQRWGTSLALTIVLSKLALLAATSLTWPLWWPWAQAAVKNYGMRKQAAYAGLWRTQVLEVESRGRPKVNYGSIGSDGSLEESDTDGYDQDYRTRRSQAEQFPKSRFSTIRTTRIVLGDPDGAVTELILPHDARFDLIDVGQAAELIVLSQSPTFESFRAVKDVYLPDSGIWLSEYPFLDRGEFLNLSLEIEKETAFDNQDEGPDVSDRFYDNAAERYKKFEYSSGNRKGTTKYPYEDELDGKYVDYDDGENEDRNAY